MSKRNFPPSHPLENLRISEPHQERQGLAAIAGQWPGFEEVAEGMGELAELRRQGGGGRTEGGAGAKHVRYGVGG